MPKTKSFRIAVAGPTIDGRVIDPAWLTQMAANYDPATYTARINCEHIAGYTPDAPFNAYGSVLSLSTQEVDLTINGETKKELALYAQIDANDQLVAINKAGQKLFTSCEIHPDFAGQGQAYLVGLAVTDNPASLGTEPLKFAALSRPNLFSTAQETAIEFTADTSKPLDADAIADAVKTGVIAGILARFSGKSSQPVTPPVEEKKTPANDNVDAAAFATAMGDQISLAVKPLLDLTTTLQSEVTDLKAQLSKTEKPQSFNRTPATGGTGIATDC